MSQIDQDHPEIKSKMQLIEPVNSEQKLCQCIQTMEEALSQPKIPRFKIFWEARKEAIECFKDSSLSPILRAQLWGQFVELTQQARQLKKIFEEKSDFHIEQIGSAIEALESEITNLDQSLRKTTEVTFNAKPRMIQHHRSRYETLQQKINLYSALAVKVHALRKEILKTEMRMRYRNEFFQRLSKAGDQVFPNRKQLIHEISQAFLDDVNSYLQKYPLHEGSNPSLQSIRSEIQALQAFAKEISLNTATFSKSRAILSEQWDKMREIEKERKKKTAENLQLYKENFNEIKAKLDGFQEEFRTGEMSTDQANRKLDEIQTLIQRRELGGFEKKALREEVSKAKEPIFEKIKQEEKECERLQKEKKDQNQRQFLAVCGEIDILEKEGCKYEINELKEKIQHIEGEIASLQPDPLVLEILRNRLSPIRDLVFDKEHSASLQANDIPLEALYQILEEKQQRKNEIKEQFEKYRKAAGASGLDFEKAISYQEQIAQERKRLELIEKSIKEVESKIEALNS